VSKKVANDDTVVPTVHADALGLTPAQTALMAQWVDDGRQIAAWAPIALFEKRWGVKLERLTPAERRPVINRHASMIPAGQLVCSSFDTQPPDLAERHVGGKFQMCAFVATVHLPKDRRPR
jgi:hypothetical protein